jgi:FdhD protein
MPGDAAEAPTSHDAVEEALVWLEINQVPAVTWMCTPDQLDNLVVGWLFGEGFIDRRDDLTRMRPCAEELGFRVELPAGRVEAVNAQPRRRVLASGCGAVTAFLGSLADVPRDSAAVPRPDIAPATMRALFKELFARGERYHETGGIHAAALTDGERLLYHAEDVGRHNAVDKVMGGAILDGRNPKGLVLLVTGRVSGELAYKAARAGLAAVATPSIPTTVATDIARRAGMLLIGRAVSGTPQRWE